MTDTTKPEDAVTLDAMRMLWNDQSLEERTHYLKVAESSAPTSPSVHRQASAETPDLCPGCHGSGEQQFMTQHLGPNDYEVAGQCSKCGGTGVPQSRQASAGQRSSMPPSKGQSSVLFEDGYAEGWAKCAEAYEARASAGQEGVKQHDFSGDFVEHWHPEFGVGYFCTPDVLTNLALSTAAPESGIDGIECHGLDTPERVCFYEQDFYVLSNFSSFALDWRDVSFDTSEAAYHYEKFIGGAACCDAIAQRILMAPSAHEAFKIAEANREHRRPDWDDVKVGIMRDILRAKATQHEYVRRKLLATGDRELVENSWRDDFWGWGPNRDGKNMLGQLWMEVRSELRAAPTAGETL